MYENFIFEAYEWNQKNSTATFRYSLDETVHFTEVITWPVSTIDYNKDALDSALFMLHLMAGISYFKAYIPQNIIIKSGSLTQKQAEFWNTVYTKGLGEFWYKNNLDWHDRITFPYTEIRNSKFDSPKEHTYINTELNLRSPLVPIGGGKDSIVTIETLKKMNLTPTLFRIGDHPLIQKQAEIAQCPLHIVERTIDTRLKDINDQGAYNGHIPITAINSCIATVSAILHGNDAIIFSNERSANEGNTEYLGLTINHQWSKSYEFERLFQNYLQSIDVHNIAYFSLLRPLSEVYIMREFCTYPQYFKSATSSNANWRIWKQKPSSLWSSDEKSAFVFALMGIFVDEATLLDIFEVNLFTMPELLDTYQALLGITPIKPFECVGTPIETQYAFKKIAEKSMLKDTVVMQMFLEHYGQFPALDVLEKSVMTIGTEHSIPQTHFAVLQEILQQPTCN